MEDVRRLLGIKIESTYWDEAYAKAKKDPQVPEWMSQEYIRSLHDDYGLFPTYIDYVLTTAKQVSQKPELCLLAKTLAYILSTKKSFSDAFTEFELPEAPDGEASIGYDCFAILPIVANLRPTWDELASRGMPEEFITSSLIVIEWLMSGAFKEAGKPCFSEKYFRLYSVAIYMKYFILNRLRFEICPKADVPAGIFRNKDGKYCILMGNTYLHKSGHILGSFGCSDAVDSYYADFVETEDAYEGYAVDETTRLAQNVRTVLPKKEWEPVFVPGDDVIRVHIPMGGKLKKEACEKSYALAKELLPRCFPEYDFKCFLTGCWMLSPELKDVLPLESNIISFQSKYEAFPLKSNAEDAFMYVFGIEGARLEELDYESLPESNSLMKGIKKKTLEKNFIYEFSGFIPWR